MRLTNITSSKVSLIISWKNINWFTLKIWKNIKKQIIKASRLKIILKEAFILI